jgi:membrane associated rhomboid family serine protease
MKQFVEEFLHIQFNKLLLSLLILFFALLAVWMLKHGAPEDGFKWASGIAASIVGALLMLLRSDDKKDPDQK